MKKIWKILISVFIVTVMIGSSLLCFAEPEAEEQEASYAYVNIYDGESVVLAMYKIEEKDEDGDGAWTINDVLISAHNDKCEDGFATADSDYGPFITKLWGIENGGSYGYYKNNIMSMSLTDAVEDGDVIYAYVYSDTATFSDAYSFFDTYAAEAEDGKITLTLKYVSGFDPETYAPIESPLEGAVITFNGEDTNFETNADGRVEIELPENSVLISAKKDGIVLIPPVCLFEADKPDVTEESEETEPEETEPEETEPEETEPEETEPDETEPDETESEETEPEETEPEEPEEPGDINNDSEANNKDVVILFRYVSGTENEEYDVRYDYNGDGEINNKDVVDLFLAMSKI